MGRRGLHLDLGRVKRGDVSELPRLVHDGVEGFLVTPGDVPALADRLTRLLTQPALAASRGRAARTRAAAHDVSAIARLLLGALRAAA